MTPADIPALLTVFGDAEVMRYYPGPLDEVQMKAWVDWNQRRYDAFGYGLWALILLSTGELIGDCGLINQVVEGVREVEIGYHVRRDLWGQGLATEAASACRDYGFDALRTPRLLSLIHPQNLASRRVAEKVGLTLSREVRWNNKVTCIYAIERTPGSVQCEGQPRL